MDLYGPSKLVFEPLSHWAVTAGLHPIPGSPSRGSCPPRCCRKWCPCPWSRCRCQWNRWLGSDRDSSAGRCWGVWSMPKGNMGMPWTKIHGIYCDIFSFVPLFLCSFVPQDFSWRHPRDAETHRVTPNLRWAHAIKKKKKTPRQGAHPQRIRDWQSACRKCGPLLGSGTWVESFH